MVEVLVMTLRVVITASFQPHAMLCWRRMILPKSSTKNEDLKKSDTSKRPVVNPPATGKEITHQKETAKNCAKSQDLKKNDTKVKPIENYPGTAKEITHNKPIIL